MKHSTGFVITRHVNDRMTNEYWKMSYQCIRKYYPTAPITIIDDNSDYNYVDKTFEETLFLTKIVPSEFPRRGEMLPYLYLLKEDSVETAVVLQDSVFLNSDVDLSLKSTENYKYLWDFEHHWDDKKRESELIKKLDNHEETLQLYRDPSRWKGCMGSMSIVRVSFLKRLHERHNLYKLTPHISCRPDRSCFERIIACLLQSNDENNLIVPSLLGNIHKYCPWGINWERKQYFTHLPVIKVWTGR